jgi:hypothetical protein
MRLCLVLCIFLLISVSPARAGVPWVITDDPSAGPERLLALARYHASSNVGKLFSNLLIVLLLNVLECGRGEVKKIVYPVCGDERIQD